MATMLSLHGICAPSACRKSTFCDRKLLSSAASGSVCRAVQVPPPRKRQGYTVGSGDLGAALGVLSPLSLSLGINLLGACMKEVKASGISSLTCPKSSRASGVAWRPRVSQPSQVPHETKAFLISLDHVEVDVCI